MNNARERNSAARGCMTAIFMYQIKVSSVKLFRKPVRSGLVAGAFYAACVCTAADFPFPQDSPERHGMAQAALDRWRERLAALLGWGTSGV